MEIEAEKKKLKKKPPRKKGENNKKLNRSNIKDQRKGIKLSSQHNKGYVNCFSTQFCPRFYKIGYTKIGLNTVGEVIFVSNTNDVKHNRLEENPNT